jgi:hypothetical protein
MDFINTDLRSILIEHEGYHQRLNAGEFDANPDSFNALMAEEHLRPIIAVIGVKGVADLLHIAHELVIQVLKDGASPEEQMYLGDRFNRVMEWGMLAAAMGKF